MSENVISTYKKDKKKKQKLKRQTKKRTKKRRDETRQDAQLTLPPPPRHCPAWTMAERPPSAALGRPTCARTVREPGLRCEMKCAGCMCAGLLCVGGPASSTRMRRSGSADARRPATRQPAVPPYIERPSQSEQSKRRARIERESPHLPR